MQVQAPLVLPCEARGSWPALVSPQAHGWEAGGRSWGQPVGPKPTSLLKWVFAPKDKWLPSGKRRKVKSLWAYCSSSLVFPRSWMAPFIWRVHCSETGFWVWLVFTYVHLLLLCLFYMKFRFGWMVAQPYKKRLSICTAKCTHIKCHF